MVQDCSTLRDLGHEGISPSSCEVSIIPGCKLVPKHHTLLTYWALRPIKLDDAAGDIAHRSEKTMKAGRKYVLTIGRNAFIN